MFNILDSMSSFMAYKFVTDDNLDLVEDEEHYDDIDTNFNLINIEDIEVTDEEDKDFWDRIEGEEYNET
ncbi:MAG: hypothetical protein PHN69_02590 [Candidatus Pacebacteria bacterium]|nr:hypothetical protein [Candidatus Paceibacterota bacterium]